jgi:hypothetical protein
MGKAMLLVVVIVELEMTPGWTKLLVLPLRWRLLRLMELKLPMDLRLPTNLRYECKGLGLSMVVGVFCIPE